MLYRALGDLWCLDLYSRVWRRIDGTSGAGGGAGGEAKGGSKAPEPPARSAHAAVNWRDQYLLIFGGEFLCLR